MGIPFLFSIILSSMAQDCPYEANDVKSVQASLHKKDGKLDFKIESILDSQDTQPEKDTRPTEPMIHDLQIRVKQNLKKLCPLLDFEISILKTDISKGLRMVPTGGGLLNGSGQTRAKLKPGWVVTGVTAEFSVRFLPLPVLPHPDSTLIVEKDTQIIRKPDPGLTPEVPPEKSKSVQINRKSKTNHRKKKRRKVRGTDNVEEVITLSSEQNINLIPTSDCNCLPSGGRPQVPPIIAANIEKIAALNERPKVINIPFVSNCDLLEVERGFSFPRFYIKDLDLKDPALEDIRQLAKYLKDNPTRKVTLVGHTVSDPEHYKVEFNNQIVIKNGLKFSGTNPVKMMFERENRSAESFKSDGEFAEFLSATRAKKIKTVLVQMQVNPTQIETRGSRPGSIPNAKLVEVIYPDEKP